jgi:hypothetical protein
MIAAGAIESTQAIIMRDIPFDIPYSVITSQSHIRKIVPAVAIVIAVSTTGRLLVSIIDHPARVLRRTIIP